MATANFEASDEALLDITSGIPGPQEGESISDYRARLDRKLMEIVAAVGDRKRRVDAFIHDHSEPKGEPGDQFYNAVRKRFEE